MTMDSGAKCERWKSFHILTNSRSCIYREQEQINNRGQVICTDRDLYQWENINSRKSMQRQVRQPEVMMMTTTMMMMMKTCPNKVEWWEGAFVPETIVGTYSDGVTCRDQYKNSFVLAYTSQLSTTIILPLINVQRSTSFLHSAVNPSLTDKQPQSAVCVLATPLSTSNA
jgi:hypothetical protein